MITKIFIGYDPREDDAFQVARYSIITRASRYIEIVPLVLSTLQDKGLFTRPLSMQNGIIVDELSSRPCSTEFSLSRFLIPHLVTTDDEWVVFCDCDILMQDDIFELEKELDTSYAVQVTKHIHLIDSDSKMDGMQQVQYARKNWSSFMAWNCKHPSNKKLTIDYFNTVHRDKLHGFAWLDDFEIGDISLAWNHLVDYKPPIDGDGMIYPQYCYETYHSLHYTHGTPDLPGYSGSGYAKEWFDELAKFRKSVEEVRND